MRGGEGVRLWCEGGVLGGVGWCEGVRGWCEGVV